MKNIHLLTLNVGVFVAIIVALTVGGFIPDIKGIIITSYGTAILIGLGISSIVTSPDKEVEEVEEIKETPVENEYNKLGWIYIEDELPEYDEVVIACIDSYDCGWVFEKLWWDSELNCWIKGFDDDGNKLRPHLNYNYWKIIDEYDYPKIKDWS